MGHWGLNGPPRCPAKMAYEASDMAPEVPPGRAPTAKRMSTNVPRTIYGRAKKFPIRPMRTPHRCGLPLGGGIGQCSR
eukprot:8525141-Pyramimonas_sp.AAC.1